MPLAAVACISLAAKLEEVHVPTNLHDLQASPSRDWRVSRAPPTMHTQLQAGRVSAACGVSMTRHIHHHVPLSMA